MTERDPIDRRADREADAAAAEAGAVGGRQDEDVDPPEQPVREAGGGEAEGFEHAEEDLREHAEHGDPGRDPTREGFEPEEGADRGAGAAGGQADEVKSTERTGEP